MNLLSSRSVLAIAAVVDIAMNSRRAPANSKAVEMRHRLPPRYLEALLQALVRANILRGTRGPRGGYVPARELSKISAGEVVRVVQALSVAKPDDFAARSRLLERVIEPSLSEASEPFLANLDAITIAQLCKMASDTHAFDIGNGQEAA